MISILTATLLLTRQALVASERPDFPANATAVTAAALHSNDVLAIVRPVRHEHASDRAALSGKMPKLWSVDTVEVLASANPALPHVLRVVTPSAGSPYPPHFPEKGVWQGMVSEPFTERFPDPRATFLLVARTAKEGRLTFDAPWTTIPGGGRLIGEIQAESPDEVAGYLLLRSDVRSVDPDPDVAHALLKTLLKGLTATDEECVRQAASLVVRTGGFGNEAKESQWFGTVARPLLRAEANRRRGYERLLLEAAWQVRLDATPWASNPIVDALGEVADSGRRLDEDDRMLIGNVRIGQIGTSFPRALAVERRTPQDWVRAMLVRALPRPADAGEYRAALGLGDDPSDRVVGALAERLAEWGGRPDLRPVTMGMARTPGSAELRGLVSSWRKVPFEALGHTEGLIPRRAGN